MTATRIWFCWITAQTNRTEHAVTDDTRPARTGVFAALCGLAFLPASMDVGPEKRCSTCVARLRWAGQSPGRRAA